MASPFSLSNVRTSQTLELDVEVGSLSVQDNGAREAATASFEVVDPTRTFILLAEDEIRITSVDNPSTEILFGGFARSVVPTIEATGRRFKVEASDYSTLLDRINVVDDTLPAHQTNVERLGYLMATYGAPELDSATTYIALLNSDMGQQRLRLMSLRQAIEAVLGAALVTANYRLRSDKKLEAWDNSGGLAAAPFDVVVASPGAGEISPVDLVIEGNSAELYNAYYVRGSTTAGSGWFTDPDSIARYGRRERFIDAPDSEFAWQAYNVGAAALVDNAWPKQHGSFSQVSPNDGWRSRQRLHVTSPHHFDRDGVALAAAAFDIASVTTTFLNGLGDRSYDIAFGDPPIRFTPRSGSESGSGSGLGGSSGAYFDDEFDRTLP